MSNFIPPSQEEIKAILTRVPKFYWPTFEHMPLNCFDLTSAVVGFPGDISRYRSMNPYAYSAYTIDIDDLDTCPRRDKDFDIEYWSERSLAVRWLLGRLSWACTVDQADYVLRQGFFSVDVNVTRFQNIPDVINVEELSQLEKALFVSFQSESEREDSKSIGEKSLAQKTVNGKSWVIVRSVNGSGFPVCEAATPINSRTVLSVYWILDECWFDGEMIPKEVEDKHLESMWDFLSQISLNSTPDSQFKVGTIVREAPGKAEKINIEDLDW